MKRFEVMKLLDNRSIFMVPFTFDDEVKVKETLDMPESIWHETELSIEKNVLYLHIQRYLQANANRTTREEMENISAEQEYCIYSLKRSYLCEEDSESYRTLKTWEFFSNLRFQLPDMESSFVFDSNRQGKDVYEKYKSGDDKYKKCKPDSLYYPTLFLWPYAHVGVLLFSVQLENSKGYVDIADLMNFNYLFRKTDTDLSQKTKTNGINCRFPIDKVEGKIEKYTPGNEKSLVGIENFENNLNGTLKLLGLDSANLASIIATCLREKECRTNPCVRANNLVYYKDKVNAKLLEMNRLEVDTEDFREIPQWNSTRLLTLFFLRGLYVRGDKDNSIIRLFNKLRMHVFTYYQLAEKEIQNNRDGVLLEFLRIAHGENQKYNLMIEDTYSAKQFVQPFKNVWFSSTVEGGAIMTLMPEKAGTDLNKIPDEFTFFKDYENSVEKRYLWIYIWVLLQRHSQLYWIDYLTKVDVSEGKSDYSLKVQDLQDKILRIQKIKVSSYFTDISDYSHHNRFYQLCKDNLCINGHFKEIEEKLIPLYEYVHMEERERKEEEESRRDKYIAIILFFLTIASFANDAAQYLTALFGFIETKELPKLLLLLLVIVPIVLLYRNRIPNKKSKNN